MRRLPPLNALRAFEAAARHLNFSHAANELGVTATAISHQVRQLEDHLGWKLFRRQPRPIALTDAGVVLFPRVRDALDGVADAVFQLTCAGSPTCLLIQMPRALSDHYLRGEMAGWQADRREIDVWVHSVEWSQEVRNEQVDVVLRRARLGSPERPADAAQDYVETVLAAECFTPMASPELLAAFGIGLQPIDAGKILNLPLISFSLAGPKSSEPTWTRWRKSAARRADVVPGLADADMRNFGTESFALDAALAGQGVVLASQLVTRQLRAEGRLIELSDVTVPGPSLEVVCEREVAEDERVRAFIQWLSAAVR